VANTRDAASSIQGSTVADLRQAWKLPIKAKDSLLGRYLATPVVADGVAYSQDQDADVQAIDISTGRVLWEKKYGADAHGPNGVIVAQGRVFGATPSKAFALDATTGRQIWATTLIRNPREEIRMPPGYRGGLVYYATSPVRYVGGEVGVLWALDARTGRRVWHFDTVPRSLWGNPDLNSGGGTNFAPAFDAEGAMYIGTGPPGPLPGTKRHPWGSSRPGPNLYTDSVVKLDARTGKLDWYYQLTPHTLCNWYVNAPVLIRSGGRDLVIAASLSGVVVALDRETGKLVWRRSVGKHNGHDNDGLLAMRGEYEKLSLPMTVYPGRYGGVLGQISTDEKTIFVPVVNGATRLTSQSDAVEVGSLTGEFVALDAASGKVKWIKRLRAQPYGAASVTNDVVFLPTFDDTLHAFNKEDGRELWRQRLPANVNGGLAISGSTILVPAGVASKPGAAALLAFRLPG
jgi:outer membrane protein assembly factor BamB